MFTLTSRLRHVAVRWRLLGAARAVTPVAAANYTALPPAASRMHSTPPRLTAVGVQHGRPSLAIVGAAPVRLARAFASAAPLPKEFCIAGPASHEDHYLLDVARLSSKSIDQASLFNLERCVRAIRKKAYFTIHGPRQSMKVNAFCCAWLGSPHARGALRRHRFCAPCKRTSTATSRSRMTTSAST